MSYSFSVRGTSKADAKAKVAADFDKVVAGQPIHARDREAALAAAGAFIDLLGDEHEREVSVSVSGYVAWPAVLGAGSEATPPLSGASVGVSAYLVAPQ